MDTEERKIKLNSILDRIRADSIWIPKSTRGTIDPKFKSNIPSPELIEIKGNSSGPMDMDAFFKSDIRILYLLKEPFIEEASFYKGDNGGHDQSKEYAGEDFDNIENPTYKNLARNIYSAISLRQFSESDQDTRTTTCFFNNNVSIVN